ncbi:Uncharacterised protein [Streptococcus milleri]|uniref:Uncharacterized protein n=1 Tax=Streptococcus milleri TaxID=33040 RepID=A0A380L8X5_9STRE|nr:hypothetical protein SCODD09_00123 [Streptococcus constellatus]SUN80634.1 Uncharacterised protein [Streptococcus milleri]
MVNSFLTTHKTEPLLIPMFWHGLMIAFIFVYLYGFKKS